MNHSKKSREFLKIVGFAALIMLGGILAGCSLSSSGVKLESKSQVIRKEKRNHGNVEFLKAEDGREPNGKKYYFKDKDCGFTYIVETYAASKGLDGSAFWYEPAKSSNYSEVYYEYIIGDVRDELQKIQQEYDKIMINESKSEMEKLLEILVFSYDEDDPRIDVEKLGREVGSLFADKDPKNRYDYIYITNGGSKCLGQYYFHTDKFVNALEYNSQYMVDYAEGVLRQKNPDAEKRDVHAVFKASKSMKTGELEGINEQKFPPVFDDTPLSEIMDIKTNVYYFEFDGEYYFVADNVYVDANDGNMYGVNYIHTASELPD